MAIDYLFKALKSEHMVCLDSKDKLTDDEHDLLSNGLIGLEELEIIPEDIQAVEENIPFPNGGYGIASEYLLKLLSSSKSAESNAKILTLLSKLSEEHGPLRSRCDFAFGYLNLQQTKELLEELKALSNSKAFLKEFEDSSPFLSNLLESLCRVVAAIVEKKMGVFSGVYP